MATLTYDPTPADEPEFSPEEQEALAIGEQAEADQQQMLAGKFKDAEALEQAYIELQKKLGEPNENETDEPKQEVRDEEDSSEEEVNPNFDLLNKASQEFYSNDGQVSAETLEELGKLDSNDLISAYIQMQGQQRQSNDLTDAQASEIRSLAGGDEEYADRAATQSSLFSVPDDISWNEYINWISRLINACVARQANPPTADQLPPGVTPAIPEEYQDWIDFLYDAAQGPLAEGVLDEDMMDQLLTIAVTGLSAPKYGLATSPPYGSSTTKSLMF